MEVLVHQLSKALKLVQAHYADAIPLDLLKTEQDRIRAGLDAITTRLDSLADTYANARDGSRHGQREVVCMSGLFGEPVPVPIVWEDLPTGEAFDAWSDLGRWVTWLVRRYRLRPREVPPWWFRHSAAVE